MKLIDEKGKLFGKINVIDLCVILIVVLALSLFAIKKVSFKKTENAGVEITYTVNIKNVRSQTVSELENSKDLGVFAGKTGEALGVITKVTSEESEDFVVDKNGNYVKTVQPDRYDVTITLTTMGTENANGVYTEGGKQLFIGEGVTISTSNIETTGEVLSIKVGK